MPYPSQFPYDLLDASPAEDAPTLQKRMAKARIERRDQAVEVRHAFDALRNPRTRLGYDILLITDVAAPGGLSNLLAPLTRPVDLPDRVEPPLITLALSELADDPSAFFHLVELRPTPITGSEPFESLPSDLLAPMFDR